MAVQEILQLGNSLLWQKSVRVDDVFAVETISVIRDLDETAVGTKLVIGVRELARAIRDDMEHEERELLSKP